MCLFKKYWWVLLALIIALRFLHFGEALDAPHVWRQSDTGQYIRHFYENGLNIFYPEVCWMGGHGTMILEFPLPEAIASVGYFITGEDHRTARFIFLLFFLLSAIYLWKTLKLLFKDGVAEVATLIYALAPLSIFYSRAIHIDFTAVAFSHIMLFYLVKGIEKTCSKDLVKGAMWGTLALLVKAPYVFYLMLPLLLLIGHGCRWRFVMRNAIWGIIPLASFMLWRKHVGVVNASAPDWGFMLSYNRFTDMWYWYFGSWDMRLDWELWDNVFQRIRIEILGWCGTVLAVVGAVFSLRRKERRFALLWLLGTLVYLAVFFNLNVKHNYYQIPFIAPLSVLIAVAIVRLAKLSSSLKLVVGGALILVFGIESYNSSEARYFRTPHIQQAISHLVEQTSEAGDLVVISNGNSTPQYPNILYGANRKGWSYPYTLQNPTMLYKLKDEGASKVYLVSRNPKLWGEMGRLFDNTLGSQKLRITGHDLNVFVIPL